MKIMKIGPFEIKVTVKNTADEPPQLRRRYYHKDNDPLDMIAYVIPGEIIDGKIVRYTKIYKSGTDMQPQTEQCEVRDFNKWYRLR